MNTMQTIDLDQLENVTGGADGKYERAAGQAGQMLGQWAARAMPAPLQPPAQMILPPAGRSLGQQAGRFVDRLFGN